MKLNPPASSSDLEAARAIARRLHRRARGHERATDADQVAGEAPPRDWTGPPASPSEAAAPEAAAPETAAPEWAVPEPAVPRLAVHVSEEADAEETEVAVPETDPFQPGPFAVSVPDLDDMETEGSGEPDDAVVVDEAGPSEGDTTDVPARDDGPPEDAAPESTPWRREATAVDPDDALAALTEDSPEAALEGLGAATGGGAVSTEDLVGEPQPPWEEDASGWPGPDEPELAPEDLINGPPPSWDDIADSCMTMARSHGAMIVDPTGQVMTARGQWPEPGPEAIGGRLVSMMEKTLRDAPTRSVSAPLAGEHLTAWRAPVAEGYLTVVFMGDSPLGNEARAAVDSEIRRALGE